MAVNEKYSFQDFMDHTFTTISASEFNNSEIVGSNFYQQNEPDSEIFPAGMTGVTFIRCNLDNVLVPSGNSAVLTGKNKCTNKRVKVQNDGWDWVVDDKFSPIEPVGKKIYINEGWSIDPADIPAKYYIEKEITKAVWDKTYALSQIPADSWFKEVPQIIETNVRQAKEDILKTAWDQMALSNDYAPFDSEPKKSDFIHKEQIVSDRWLLEGQITVYKVRGEGILFKAPTKKTIKKGVLP